MGTPFVRRETRGERIEYTFHPFLPCVTSNDDTIPSVVATIEENTSKTHKRKRVAEKDEIVTPVEWTPAEDRIIRSMVKEEGRKWHKIAQHLPGRSSIAIRHRWNRISKE